MNYAKKNLMINIIFLIIGLIFLFVALFGGISDNYRNSMIYGLTGSFIALGVLGIVVSGRLVKNPKKAEAIEIAKKEERTQFIRTKANSITYTIMIYVQSAGILVMGLLNHKEASEAMAAILIIEVIIYIITLGYYGKKY